MKMFNRPVPTVSTSIPDIIGASAGQVTAVGLQAPESNSNTIFFGNKSEQPFELRPSANALLPVNSVKDLFLYGSSGDRISIGLF